MSQVEKVKQIIKDNERLMKRLSNQIDDLEKENDASLADDIKDLYNELRTYEEWDSAYRFMAKELGLL